MDLPYPISKYIFSALLTPKREIKGVKIHLISDACLCGYSEQLLSANSWISAFYYFITLKTSLKTFV